MDAPRIQYATTADGVRIAFWVLGEGPALVIPPILGFRSGTILMETGAQSHVQLEWELPPFREAYEGLAEGCRVIRYDHRGTGLSQRDAIDFSHRASSLDLEAVIARLGLEEFAMLDVRQGWTFPMRYTAENPQRVSRFVISVGSTRLDAPGFAVCREELAALRALRDADWGMYWRLRWRVFQGVALDHPEGAVSSVWMPMEENLRESLSQDAYQAIVATLPGDTPRALLESIETPTLVLHALTLRDRVEEAQALAAAIPGSELATFAGKTLGSLPNPAAVEQILRFLGADTSAGRRLAPPATGGFRTILFTDIEGHTAMMQRLGDNRGREILRRHERLTREQLQAHGGTEVKTLGDGFMASFVSAQQALECAIGLQRAFLADVGEILRVRVGINAGEPIAEDDDLFGASVIAAARIAAQAAGGEVLVSNVVRELVAGKGFHFADRGAAALRGLDEPVRLFELRWAPDSPG